MAVVRHKAAIHSGHFMVSDFEPDEQDEQEEVQVVDEGAIAAIELKESQIVQPRTKYASGNKIRLSLAEGKDHEISLTSLFKSMSMKYRFQLTSPRWNRFRGLKLRWKDKIRMNNVIWRCWHMQFVQNDPKSLCAFANPMEIDNHRKTEGSTLLEGKYWKRKTEKVVEEYNVWRKKEHIDCKHKCCPKSKDLRKYQVFQKYNYETKRFEDIVGNEESSTLNIVEGSKDDVDLQSLLNDEGLIVDLLLNTFQESSNENSDLSAFLSATTSISGGSNPSNSVSYTGFPFPNTRDYYKHTTNADLLQPGLGPLQPSLDGDMEIDLDWLSNLGVPTKTENVVAVDNNPVPSATATKASNVIITTETSPVIMMTAPFGQQFPAQPQQQPHSGGGKQRAMINHSIQQQPITAQPYPTGDEIEKQRSNSRKILQPRYDLQSNLATSELVQLLKTPKAESDVVVLNGGSQSICINSTHPFIPPPLPTDYQIDPTRKLRNTTNPDEYQEHRRSVHINAEQNRRTSIKHGFEELRALIPSLRDVPTSSHKISKAALLHKGGDYIREMKGECANMEREAVSLKQEIERLEVEVSGLQGFLPSQSSNVEGKAICGLLRQKKIKEDKQILQTMLKKHIAETTGVNWKYWAYSVLMQPHFDSYTEAVSGSATSKEMERCIHRWLEDKFSLMQLRQATVSSLKNISIKTNVISDPRKLPQDSLDNARRQDELQ